MIQYIGLEKLLGGVSLPRIVLQNTIRRKKMRKMLVFVVLFCMLVTASGVAVSAQTGGAPDPTGLGRYTTVGGVKDYPNASVSPVLPGSPCAPADELVGSNMHNSVSPGKANLVRIEKNATVSVATDGRIFLCRCMGGYNQLFRLESKPEPMVQQEVVQKTAYQEQTAKAESTSSASLTVQAVCNFQTIPIQNGTSTFYVCPNKEPQLVSTVTNQPPPVATTAKKEKDTRSFCERHPNWCVGISFVAGAGAGYGLAQIGGGSKAIPPVVFTGAKTP